MHEKLTQEASQTGKVQVYATVRQTYFPLKFLEVLYLVKTPKRAVIKIKTSLMFA